MIDCDDICVVCINDIADNANLAYLLKYDSVLGRLNAKIEVGESVIKCNDREIVLTSFSNPKDLDFAKLGISVDCVIESSGCFKTKDKLDLYLQNGAKKVLLTAPPSDDMSVYVCGVNEIYYNGESIISNASCTSNAIAPIIKILKEPLGIECGNITTIHPFNSDQSLLDSANKNGARLSRNSALNIIPTSSSIGAMIGVLFKEFDNRFYGDSIRVPTSLVSLSNIDLYVSNVSSKDEVLRLLGESKIIGIDYEKLVSNDFVGDNRSAIVIEDLLKVNGNLLRISIWFDNESGYASRLIDMLRVMFGRS